MRATANDIINGAAADNAKLDRMVQTLKNGASMNRADKFFEILNMIYSCLQRAARCGSANDATEKAELLETVKLECMHIEQMKIYFRNEQYDKIVPRTK
jgi:hypothetical protein